MYLDGQLIQSIFEKPKWTAEYLKNVKVQRKNDEIIQNYDTNSQFTASIKKTYKSPPVRGKNSNSSLK